MNQKITEHFRKGCVFANQSGMKLVRGPWAEWTENRIIACDAMMATLLLNKLVATIPDDSSNPGYTKLVSELLDVDRFWIHRFSMGWDRNHHVTLVMKEKDTDVEIKDDVSAFGIQLWKEFGKEFGKESGSKHIEQKKR